VIWLALQLGCHSKDDAPAKDDAADADTDTDADADADADTDGSVAPPSGTLVLTWAIAGSAGGKTCSWGDDDYFPSWPSQGTIWSLNCTDAPEFRFFATHQPDAAWHYTPDEVHLSLQGEGVDTAALAVESQSVSVEAVDAAIPSVKGSFSVTYTDGSTLDGTFDTYVAP
jgi:hypothetical protein